MPNPPALPDHDWPRMDPGWVWLVGAGPGDPGLITLHGLNALAQADVVVHDALAAPALLGWARPGAMIEDFGKRGGRPSPTQPQISARLIALARSGARVLRLKGGDPFVFGRGAEEAQDLVRAGIPLRLVPGISAGIGGLAYAGIPLTHRDVNQAVTLVTGHDQTGQAPGAVAWEGLAQASPVIVAYMAVRTLDQIVPRLLAGGRDPADPVAIVEGASLPGMRVLETTLGTCLADLAASGLGAPAIVCFGRVVLLRQMLDWLGAIAGTPPRSLDPLG